MIGSLVRGSGFEDIVFQSELCTSGSLQGVLTGSHYNRAWAVHRVMSESFERLFMDCFLYERKPNIPDELSQLVLDPQPNNIDERLQSAIDRLSKEYEKYREDARSGKIGKTGQFWVLYMDLMRLQILAHTAVQSNDFGMLLHGWKSFLPMYFATNKVNYTRYFNTSFVY